MNLGIYIVLRPSESAIVVFYDKFCVAENSRRSTWVVAIVGWPKLLVDGKRADAKSCGIQHPL
jgi:hypothetical protein